MGSTVSDYKDSSAVRAASRFSHGSRHQGTMECADSEDLKSRIPTQDKNQHPPDMLRPHEHDERHEAANEHKFFQAKRNHSYPLSCRSGV
jgi:hypothetical protein